MKVCKECGIEFEPKNKKGIFCSFVCRQRDYRKNVASKLREYGEIKKLPLSKNVFIDIKGKQTINSVSGKPVTITLTEKDKAEYIHELSDYELQTIRERIAILKRELANVPEHTVLPKSMYISVRKKELLQLENKLT